MAARVKVKAAPTGREPKPLAVLSPATGRKDKAPTGVYHFFRLAIERAGAVEFCAPCYAYALPGHARYCRPTGRAFNPTTATLAGGLDAPQERK